MFDTLSERLQSALGDVRSRGKLTEDDVNKAMRAIRLALLEADVNFQVVKQFTSAVKERALGAEVLEALNPGQQVVKLVDLLADGDELDRLAGDGLHRQRGPAARIAVELRQDDAVEVDAVLEHLRDRDCLLPGHRIEHE